MEDITTGFSGSLVEELNNISDVAFSELYMALQVAKFFRTVESKHKLKKDDLMAHFGFSDEQYRKFRNGSFNYTLMHIAKLEEYSDRLNKEKFETENESRIFQTAK